MIAFVHHERADNSEDRPVQDSGRFTDRAGLARAAFFLLICKATAGTAMGCADTDTFNPGDPTSSEYYLTGALSCVLGDPTCPAPTTPETTTTTPTITCPTGFARVPFNAAVGTTSDFCVAKYEMKCAADATGLACSGTALSQAANLPWVQIDQTNAAAACAALGTGYHLITNEEWMTIARDVENTAANWSGGSVASGSLAQGHSDNAPDGAGECSGTPTPACPAGTDDTNGYFGTGNNSGQAFGSGGEQRRTNTLSSGEIIWDLGGNVWEWIDYTVVTDKANSGGGTVNIEAMTATTAMPVTSFQPTNTSLTTATNRLGQYLPGTNGSGGAGQRGGQYTPPGNTAGIFAFDISLAATFTNNGTGFRCAYTP